MSGFQELPKAIDEGAAYEPIEAADVAFTDEQLSDLDALKTVVQDATVAERFVLSKTLVQEWNLADDLNRAYVPVAFWDKAKKKARSTLPMPIIMEAVESLLPQAHMAFFSDSQPFLLDPKGNTAPETARAMAHAVCWAIEESGFEEEIRKVLKSALLYGTGVGKLGWTTAKHTEKKYRRGTNGVESESKERSIARPTFEYVSLRNVLVSPHTDCHDIRTSPFVIHQKYIDAHELDGLRDAGYKNIPSRKDLATVLAAATEVTRNTLKGLQYVTWRENQAELPQNAGAADPLKQKLELLEYWTGDRVVTVLQRCLVIRNEENPLGELPFRSCAFIDVLNSFYGFGVAKLLAGEQGLQTGVTNLWVDALGLKLNPTWHRKKGAGTMSQNIEISPGRIVNDDGDLAPLPIESVSEEALNAINASESRAARRVGSNFGPDMPTQAMRTAEGVQAFTSGVQVRLQYFIENFANLVFVPTIKSFIGLLKDNLQPEEVNAILSEREGKAFQGDIMDVYNGQYTVDVLSSVKLTGRRAMAQMLIPQMQMLGQPAVLESFNVQAKKFNWVQFFGQIFDVTGWPAENLILDMTPEDQQRLVMREQAAAQAKMQQQMQNHQNALELTDRKGDVQAGVSVVKSTLKAHEEPAEPLATQPKNKK